MRKFFCPEASKFKFPLSALIEKQIERIATEARANTGSINSRRVCRVSQRGSSQNNSTHISKFSRVIGMALPPKAFHRVRARRKLGGMEWNSLSRSHPHVLTRWERRFRRKSSLSLRLRASVCIGICTLDDGAAPRVKCQKFARLFIRQ